jgi:dTDP-4-amino-4,6-dideoxygalactose transaminase
VKYHKNGVHRQFKTAFTETPVKSPLHVEQPFIVFGKPDIGLQEKEAVRKVLDSGWLSTGSVVKDFETEFGHFLGTGYCVAVSSCTDGLILSLLAAGIGRGDEVITTPLTFAATVNAILAVGAEPVFVDVDENGQIDPNEVAKAAGPCTKAILPVHYTGASPDMAPLQLIARDFGLVLIEDAAHGFGGSINGNPLGTIGDFGCFSFYPTKNITSIEGGMVVTKTAENADKVRTLSMNGLSSNAFKRYGSGPIRKYEVSLPGLKANMTDVNAAVGLTQLRRWPELRAKRDTIWGLYESAFGEKGRDHARHLYTIQHPHRDNLRAFLHEKGIGTGIHFNPLHLEPAYSCLGYRWGAFPRAESIGASTLSLPVSATMHQQDAVRVINAVKEFGGGK